MLHQGATHFKRRIGIQLIPPFSPSPDSACKCLSSSQILLVQFATVMKDWWKLNECGTKRRADIRACTATRTRESQAGSILVIHPMTDVCHARG
ncbi:hypothetical protein GLOTRDRAFT_111105, partial [Gloeophyllum trabeum ATCC 11539]